MPEPPVIPSSPVSSSPRRRSADRDPSYGGGRGKRERILDAALEVCSARGFDAARMEEIATRAAVSKGTLYNFFESKEALIIAAVLYSYEAHPLLSAPPLEAASLSHRERVERLLEQLRVPFERFSAFLPVGFQAWALAVRDPLVRERLSHALQAIYRRNSIELEKALRAAVDAGELEPGPAVAGAVTALLATFDGLLYRSVFDPDGANRDTLQAAHDALIDALFARRGSLDG